MKKIGLIIILSAIFLFFSKTSWAAYFKLEPSSINKNTGEEFTVDVYVDSGSEEIRGVDIYLTFDGNLISAQSVSSGGFFSNVNHNISSNEVYIAGVMDDISSKTGLGKVASVNFKANNGGSGTIGFNCSQSVIVKADIDGTNILSCSSNVSANFTISGGSSSGGSNTGDDGGDSNGSTGDNNSNYSNNPPTRLPTSGFIDKMKNWAILSLVLLLIGGALKFII